MGVVRAADSDGGGNIPAGVDGRGKQTADRSDVSGAASNVLSPPAEPESARAASGALLAVWRESRSGLQPAGSPANWRCVVLEKLSRVRSVEGAWRTGPNHSRPTSCVLDADIDADHPERDPQKGH